MTEMTPLSGFASFDAVELRPAKINDRFIAYLFDTLPFVAGYYFSLVVLMTKMPQLTGLAAKLAGVWAGLYCFYHFLATLSGGTLGKRLLGIQVVDWEGNSPGAARSLIRAVGNVLSTPLCNFGYLVALFHPESRALHDILAGTLVVESRPKSSAESGIFFLVAISSVIAMFGGSFYLTLTQPTPTDLRAIAKAREGLKIMASIEEAYKASHPAYTESLADLAGASGDVERFKSAMEELFDPGLFEIKAGNKRYRITAAAKDRKKTRVTIEGPSQ